MELRTETRQRDQAAEKVVYFVIPSLTNLALSSHTSTALHAGCSGLVFCFSLSEPFAFAKTKTRFYETLGGLSRSTIHLFGLVPRP
jgi:hypothetical protein